MAIQKLTVDALADNTITDSVIADDSIDIEKLSNVNLNIAPEILEIQVDAPDSGQDTMWKWTWEQSTLPYARRTITNSPEVNVPLYKQGTYTVNNFAAYDIHGSMTQTHSLYLKWVDGAGTDNLISWATSTGPISDTHPDINGGNATDVQRISVNVPSTITPPSLANPSVSYTIANSGSGSYTFSGAAKGDNPNLGPVYRGGTYTFNVNATGHPFYLTTDNGTNFSAGTYFGEYTSGVTGSRNDSGTITFTVPANAPDTLYYQCGNHGAMRGEITIKDLAVETNINGNYVVYFQHTQEGHKTAVELRPIPSLVNQMCIVYDASSGQFVPQDLSTYVENTPSFENKIREVAGTAELVVEDGSAVIAKVNVYDDSTYLPLTGNNAGDQAFATDTDILYIWDGSAWQQAGAANSDDLTEGSTNLFFTDARADARIALQSGANLDLSGKSTTDLSEGTNLYYTDARADARITASDTDALSEGTTNLYYTDARADARAQLKVDALVDAAPGTLDTLNELAAALGDDPNFATTTANNIATKLPLAGGTLTGHVNGTTFGTNLPTPVYIGGTPADLNTAEVGPGYINLARDDTADAAQIRFAKNGSLHSYIETSTNGLRFITDVGDISLQGGNVGIGNPTPDQKLTIGVDDSSSNVGYIRLRGHNALESNIYKTASYGIHMDTDSNSQGIRIDGGKLVLGMTGNVGIGTETPSSQYFNNLVVGNNDAGDKGITIRSNPSNKGVLAFSDTDAANAERYSGYIAYDHDNNSMQMYTNGGSERMRIDSGGVLNVTSAGAPITPTIKHSGVDPYLAKIRLINRSGQYIDKGGLVELGGITNDEVTRTDVFASVAGLKATTASNNRTGYMQFSVNDGSTLTERMRIDSSGNVGIGTSDPNAKLDISAGTASGTMYNALVLRGGQNSTQGSGVRLHMTGTENDALARGVILQSEMTNNGNNHDFSVWTSQASPHTKKFTIDNQGQVAIGTDAPSGTRLHIQVPNSGSGLTDAVKISDSSGYPDIAMYVGAADGEIRLGSAGQLRGKISGAGVGSRTDHNFDLYQNGTTAAGLRSSINGTGRRGLHMFSNSLGFDQPGVRSWEMRAEGGNLRMDSGDGYGKVQVSAGFKAKSIQLGNDSANSTFGAQSGYIGDWWEAGHKVVYYLGYLGSSASTPGTANWFNFYTSGHWGQYTRVMVYSFNHYPSPGYSKWDISGTTVTQVEGRGSQGSVTSSQSTVSSNGHSGQPVYKYTVQLTMPGTYTQGPWFVALLGGGGAGHISNAHTDAQADAWFGIRGGGMHLRNISTDAMKTSPMYVTGT
jgi:hypothetical protein